MNVLTSMLEQQMRAGSIQGVKLAPTAPAISNLLYADDLLLLGLANRTEARRIRNTLHDFCKLSGQRVSPEKSKLWFSKSTPLMGIAATIRTFRANFADNTETYLGGSVTAARPSDFEGLIQKVDNRLHTWKARLLSPAGKLVLMKAVLESLPIYHMSTTPIHISVLDKIKSRCIQFFWGTGKTGKKGICYVKWSLISTPKSEGGLGMRDLVQVNNAMLAKNIWKVTSGDEALWVQVLRAKYHPSSTFWLTGRRTDCTRLWKGMLHIRSVMLNFSKWMLGDG